MIRRPCVRAMVWLSIALAIVACRDGAGPTARSGGEAATTHTRKEAAATRGGKEAATTRSGGEVEAPTPGPAFARDFTGTAERTEFPAGRRLGDCTRVNADDPERQAVVKLLERRGWPIIKYKLDFVAASPYRDNTEYFVFSVRGFTSEHFVFVYDTATKRLRRFYRHSGY